MTAKIRPLFPHVQPIPMPLPAGEKQLRAAARAGWDDGERHGYVAGWRVGLGYGLAYGTAIGAASCMALVALGRMVG